METGRNSIVPSFLYEEEQNSLSLREWKYPQTSPTPTLLLLKNHGGDQEKKKGQHMAIVLKRLNQCLGSGVTCPGQTQLVQPGDRSTVRLLLWTRHLLGSVAGLLLGCSTAQAGLSRTGPQWI